MKALTIKQPWCDAIAHGPKRVENRSWPLPARYLGARVLIHAAATEDRAAILPFGENTARANGTYPGVRGAVIATARITGCHFDAGCCRPWGMTEVFHWTLADVVPLPRPVPAKGALGFWRPPAEVLAAVQEQTVPAA